MSKTELDQKTSGVLEISRDQALAHSVMMQTDEQRAKTIDRLRHIKNRAPIARILIGKMLGLRDCTFMYGLRDRSSAAILSSVADKEEVVRAEHKGCKVKSHLIYNYSRDSELFRSAEPCAIEFFCTAENCCKAGIGRAMELTKQTLDKSVTSLEANIHEPEAGLAEPGPATA